MEIQSFMLLSHTSHWSMLGYFRQYSIAIGKRVAYIWPPAPWHVGRLKQTKVKRRRSGNDVAVFVARAVADYHIQLQIRSRCADCLFYSSRLDDDSITVFIIVIGAATVEAVAVRLQFIHICCMLVAVGDTVTCLLVEISICLNAGANEKARERKRGKERDFILLACERRAKASFYARGVVSLRRHVIYFTIATACRDYKQQQFIV